MLFKGDIDPRGFRRFGDLDDTVLHALSPFRGWQNALRTNSDNQIGDRVIAVDDNRSFEYLGLSCLRFLETSEWRFLRPKLGQDQQEPIQQKPR